MSSATFPLVHLTRSAKSAALATSFVLFVAGIGAAAQAAPAGTARASGAYRNLPLQFEQNRGQVDPSVKFVSHGQGYGIFLQPTAATFALHKEEPKPEDGKVLSLKPVKGEVVRMALVGANGKAAMSAEKPLKGYVNYMIGSDQSKWQRGIPTFAQTRVAAVYPGVDLVYYGTQRQLEYDFVVAPGAKAESIRFALAGAKPVLSANGELVLQIGKKSSDDDLRFRKPVLYQQANGKRQPVDGSFTVAANGEVGFHVGAYDHARELVIDPIISYASYFGGPSEDEINGSALNSAGQLYAVGQTFSSTLPSTAGEYQATSLPNTANGGNGHDGFVTKFSADGTSVLWTTFLGGSLETFANAVAVSAADNAYVTGSTGSTGNTYFQSGATYSIIDFPVTANAYQPLSCPTGDQYGNGQSTKEVSTVCGTVFVTELSSDGKSLVYSTFLGSTGGDAASAIAVDGSGNIYVAGNTYSTGYYYAQSSNLRDQPQYPVDQHGTPGFGSTDFPTTPNAYSSAFAVAKQLAIAAGPDPNGNMGNSGNQMGFVSVFNAAGALTYSSTIGGSGVGGCGNGVCNQYATTVAPGLNGIVYVGGVTSSSNFPVTTGAFVPACSAGTGTGLQCPPTGWLAAFDTTKSGVASLAFSTYMTGTDTGTDYSGNKLRASGAVYGVTTDSTGNVIATGSTDACNFPTTPGVIGAASLPQGDGNGDSNTCYSKIFLTKLSSTGSTVWSTYVAGPTKVGAGSTSNGNAVAVDATGNVYVLATTNDDSLPVKNSIYPGGNDGYLAELSPDATQLLMATFIGTTGPGGPALDANSLHLDSNANAYISGSAGCGGYGCRMIPATAGAFLTNSAGGNSDGWVMKIITQQQPSATALTVSPNPATPTQTVTLTATVTTTSTIVGSLLPTGTVTFLNGTTTLGTGTLNASGVATYSGTLAGGSYNVTASYAGDAGFNSSVSIASPLNVSTAVNTTTTLTVSPASAAYGAGSTLTATVMAGTAPATSGTVSFTAGTLVLGTATVNASGVATTTVKPGVGIYSVIASYAGTYSVTSNPTGFGPSASTGVALTVTKAASTTTLASSTMSAGTGVSFTLTATVPTGATGTVTFYNGTASLGTGTVGTGGTATLAASIATAGSYSLTATYGGDTNFSASTSTGLTQVVAVPGFTATASPLSLTITRGSTGTTTITLTPQGGYTGAITFSCGTLPSKATCSFAQTSVTLGSTAVTNVLTIGTGSASAMLSAPHVLDKHDMVFTATMLWMPGSLLALFGLARRKKLSGDLRRLTLLVAFGLLGMGAISGCAGGSSSDPGANETPAGSYTVPVTISGPTGSAQSLNLTVVVQ